MIFMKRRFITGIIFALILTLLSGSIARFQTSHAATPELRFIAESKPKPYSRKPTSEALKWADGELKKMSLD